MNALENEFAAWCEIAMLCDRQSISYSWFYGQYGVIDLTEMPRAWGLCDLVNYSIDGPTVYMEHRLEANRGLRDKPNRGYWWPRDLRGWQERQRFAWKMAAQCEQEMNVKI